MHISRHHFGCLALSLIFAACLASLPGCRMVADGQNIEGVRLLEQGHPHAALQRFQQVAATNPANADAYYNMAATYHRLGSDQADKSQLDRSTTSASTWTRITSNAAVAWRCCWSKRIAPTGLLTC